MGMSSDNRTRLGTSLGAGVAAAAMAVTFAAGHAWAARTVVRRLATSRPAATVPTTFPAAVKGARITKDGWFAPRRRGQEPPALPEKVTNAFILSIREPISAKTFESLQRRLFWAKDKEAQLIVLDVDTWGGEVHAALDIARLLKLELEGIYTVCFLRTRAVSAGTLIAMACDEIVVTTVGKLGDCAPISPGARLEGIQREKIESLLRMELVESAEMNGYPAALAECMVTIERQAWLVRNVRTRELRYVLARGFRDRVRRRPGATSQPARPKAEWEVLRVVVSDDELLTLHPRLVLEYGFAARQVKIPPKGNPWANLIELFHVVSEPVVLEDAWPDELVLSRARPARNAILADARLQPPRGRRSAARTAAKTRSTTAAVRTVPDAPEGARIVTVEGKTGWFAPRKPGTEPPALPEKVTKAFIIPIREPIRSKTYEALKRKVIHAKGKGAGLVVFDMKTPGGSGEAMRNIVRLILDEIPEAYTVAYVNPEAFSAGAIISLACNEIVMSPTGVIGDAMPIMVGPSGIAPLPDKERGKIESAIRSEVRVLAKRNGYNVALCEAMVTITKEIWLIRHRKTGEFRMVDAKAWRGRASGAPVTTQPARPAGADAEWEYVKTLDGDDELVTVTADEAVLVGLAKNVFDSMDDLVKHFNVVTPPTVLEDTWSEKLVAFLTSPIVTSLLVLGGLVCAYSEAKTPGLGVAGALAVVCFAIVFGSRFLIGLAAWWEIALFVVGLMLVGLEIFVTPGFGVLGISGILCCVVALLAMVVPNPPNKLPIPDTELAWAMFETGVAALIVGMIGAVIVAILLTRYLPKMPVAGRLVLAPSTVVPSATTDDAPITAVQVGDVGTVHSVCRPVGQVRFGEALVDAMAEGSVIPAGAKVRVLKKEGNRVVVTREG